MTPLILSVILSPAGLSLLGLALGLVAAAAPWSPVRAWSLVLPGPRATVLPEPHPIVDLAAEVSGVGRLLAVLGEELGDAAVVRVTREGIDAQRVVQHGARDCALVSATLLREARDPQALRLRSLASDVRRVRQRLLALTVSPTPLEIEAMCWRRLTEQTKRLAGLADKLDAEARAADAPGGAA